MGEVAEMRRESRAARARFSVLAAAVGLGAGGGGTLLHLSVDALLSWPVCFADSMGRSTAVPVAALVAAILATLSAMIVRRVAPEAAGSGVQEVEGTLEDLRPLRWRRVLPVKLVAGILALSSGLVLPVLATCLIANITAEGLGGRPIYEQLLERTLKRAGVERPPPARDTTVLA